MRRWWTAPSLLAAYVLVLGCLLLLLPDRSPPGEVAAAMSVAGAQEWPAARAPWWQQVFRPSQHLARQVLGDAIPGLDPAPEPAPAPGDLVLSLVTGAELSRPHAFFEMMLPFLAGQRLAAAAAGRSEAVPATAPALIPVPAAVEPAAPVVAPLPPPAGPQQPPAPIPKGPLVGIYHTHDWESYIDQVTPGTDPILMSANDHRRTVVRVGEELAKALEQQGITVVHSEASHQKNGYLGAYGLSRETATQLLQQNPSLRVLIDLHRDALPRQYYVASVGGQTAAKIDIVIGAGDNGLPQPHWAENDAFAHRICDAVNARYGGLCRGVLVKQDRYNQDLLPGAVLIEVGTSYSKMEEALRAVDLLAPVLADLVNHGKYPGAGSGA